MLPQYKRTLPTLAAPLMGTARRYASPPKPPPTTPIYGSTAPTGTEWCRPLTPLERNYAADLLQRGCQPWEVALDIGRSKDALLGELASNKALARFLQRTKSGPWSEKEEEKLTDLLRERTGIDKEWMAKEMGRPVGEIAKEVARRNKARKRLLPAVVVGRGVDKGKEVELDMRERRTIRRRLDRILEGLFRARMTDEWRTAVDAVPRDVWVDKILAMIPPRVGRVLAARQPPTVADLAQLGWPNDDEKEAGWMGAYVWLLKPRQHNPVKPLHYLYVGSATAVPGGLRLRREEHEGSSRRDGGEGLHRRMKEHALTRRWARFAMLLSLEVDGKMASGVLEGRRVVVLAEAAMAVWLGALGDCKTVGRRGRGPLEYDDDGGCNNNNNTRSSGETNTDTDDDDDDSDSDSDISWEEEQERLRRLCPWDRSQLEWPGLCSHNPLILDIKHPAGSKRRTARGEDSDGGGSDDSNDNVGSGIKHGISFGLPNLFKMW